MTLLNLTHSAGVRGSHSHTWLFIWTPCIWTQVLVLTQQALLPTKPSPRHAIFYSAEKFCRKLLLTNRLPPLVPRATAGPWSQRTICRISTFIEETAEKQREINQIFVHWVEEETMSAGQGKPGWNMWNPFQSASRSKSFRIEIEFCYKYDRCIIFGIHIYVHMYAYPSPSSSTN